MLEFENWDLIEHYIALTETTIDALGFLPSVIAFSVILHSQSFSIVFIFSFSKRGVASPPPH